MTGPDGVAAHLKLLSDTDLTIYRKALIDGSIGAADSAYALTLRLGASNATATSMMRAAEEAVRATGDAEQARWLLVGSAAPRPRSIAPSLVWTSPRQNSRARDTAAVLRERVAASRASIVIVGYSVTPGADALFDDLGRAAERGVRISLVADRLEEKLPLIRSRWPSGAPRPELWTREADAVDPMSALHAKVAIFDHAWLLVSSANLTYHGLRGNLELGVLLAGDVAREATELVREWIGARLVTSVADLW